MRQRLLEDGGAVVEAVHAEGGTGVAAVVVAGDVAPVVAAGRRAHDRVVVVAQEGGQLRLLGQVERRAGLIQRVPRPPVDVLLVGILQRRGQRRQRRRRDDDFRPPPGGLLHRHLLVGGAAEIAIDEAVAGPAGLDVAALLGGGGRMVEAVAALVEEELRGDVPREVVAEGERRDRGVAVAEPQGAGGSPGFDLPPQVGRVGVAGEVALEMAHQRHAPQRVGSDLDDAWPLGIRQPDAPPEEVGVRLHGLDRRGFVRRPGRASRCAVRVGPSR